MGECDTQERDFNELSSPPLTPDTEMNACDCGYPSPITGEVFRCYAKVVAACLKGSSFYCF